VLGKRIFKHDSLGCQAVDIGGLNKIRSVTAQKVRALLIRKKKNNIRFFSHARISSMYPIFDL
jgi:hypothetical protein